MRSLRSFKGDVEKAIKNIISLRDEEDIPEINTLQRRTTSGDIFSTQSESITASKTIGENNFHIDADATGGVVTVTFEASPRLGQLHSVSKSDASGNAVTVNGNGKNINGSATDSLASQYSTGLYIYTGVEWRII